jgi:hypothetical protein
VALLGHKSCRVRETATKKLRDNLTADTVRMLERALTHEDREIARRAELLLRPYYEALAQQAVAKAKASCGGKLPWLDQLPYDYPNREMVLARHLTHARQTCGGGTPEWPDYRLATEYHLLDLARQQLPIEELVNTMKQREIQWIRSRGQSYTPPLTVTWR